MSDVNQVHMIGLDWGTTSFRGFLIGEDGQVIEKTSSDDGILSIKDNDFEGPLLKNIEKWLKAHPQIPIIASGMITSRNGWLETPYSSVPAKINDFANALSVVELSIGSKVHFITGASFENENGTPDIMRGEETQIIGASETRDEEIFLLPGTHSKWAITCNENIQSFTSFMTGEVYALLKDHSILGALMNDQSSENRDAFIRGVRDRANQETSILHHIFSARTLPLFEKMKQNEIADYLSGLLIAEEIKSAFSEYKLSKDSMIKIIGHGDLASRYADTLDEFGIQHAEINDEITALGHYKIAKMAGLLT